MMHDDNVIVVTGGGSGIGRAAAVLFAREGASVAVADRAMDGAAETVSLIEADGGDAGAFAVDVADEAAVEAMVAAVTDRFGRIDGAFNNAGITQAPTAFHELDADAWHEMLAINLSGVFWCLKHEIRQMLAQPARDGVQGSIVNTSSGAGIVPAPGLPHYTAAKHGVVGLTKCVAAEYGGAIRCNTVMPGVTDTPMIQGFLEGAPAEIRKIIESSVPGEGMVRPEEVAELAVWLCSMRAKRVNGQSVMIDGGATFH